MSDDKLPPKLPTASSYRGGPLIVCEGMSVPTIELAVRAENFVFLEWLKLNRS